MRIGAILAAARLVDVETVRQALRRQLSDGGRIGDNLVALGAVDREELEAVAARIPQEPRTVAETGIPEKELLSLLIKHIHIGGLETISAMRRSIKLGPEVLADVIDLGARLKLISLAGVGTAEGEMRYMLTDAGRRWALEALDQSQYLGPAPVSLDTFCAQLERQRIGDQRVTQRSVLGAFSDLVVSDRFVRQIGPALNSGRCVLLYGPPGNGKTSIALRLHRIFDDLVFMPYAVSVDGQIMRVFDPALHKQVPVVAELEPDRNAPSLIREDFDERWVPCRRPFIVTGGELTVDMLDLRYDATSKFYEAPMPVKALSGCFVIDDFGRQSVSPATLLNRWIVPLENRFDFLKLHTGKSFRLPFDELVVFSTNYAPETLLDAALLRRIPYKLEVAGPSTEEFRRIIDGIAAFNGMTISDEMFDFVVHQLTEVKKVRLAAYHANFLVEQMLAAAKYMEHEPRFDRELIEDAVLNLRVARGDGGDEALSGLELIPGE
jgi:hypothetical protein